MSKSSLIIGLLVSVLVHGAILLPDAFRLTLEMAPGAPADDPVAVKIAHAPQPEATPTELAEDPAPNVIEPEIEHTAAPSAKPVSEESIADAVEQPVPEGPTEPEATIVETAQAEVISEAPPETDQVENPSVLEVADALPADMPDVTDIPPAVQEVEPEPLRAEVSDAVRDTEALERVIESSKPRAPSAATAQSSTSDANAEEDRIPNLRIEWDSPRDVFTVAQALGMRVVAIDYSNAILGELRSATATTLVPFDGRLSGYSNRIRTLHREYFGPSHKWSPNARVAALWILVPAHVDRAMVSAQLDAIQKAGRQPGDVQTTIGYFKRVGGRYRLIISSVK